MLEEEIQKQWDIKAEKNNLSVLNVKNILKVRESLLRLNFDIVIVSREGSSAFRDSEVMVTISFPREQLYGQLLQLLMNILKHCSTMQFKNS